MERSAWIQGKAWDFGDERQKIVIADIVKSCGKRTIKELLINPHSFTGKKLRLQSDFISSFEHQDFILRKGKKGGTKDKHFEMMCPGDRRDRAPTCTFRAKFKWENETNGAVLEHFCLDHSCGQVYECKRSKMIPLMYASVEDTTKEILDAWVLDRSEESLEKCLGALEREIPMMVPNVHTLREYVYFLFFYYIILR